MITIVPATIEHARAIDLRTGDAREIAALGLAKEDAIGRSLSRALWADAYLADGEVAAIVGVSCETMLGDRTAWMLTGKPVDRCRKDFLRLTRARVAEMLAEHGHLTCTVHADYPAAIRWLRWLGFEIGPAHAGFHKATLRRRGPVVVQPGSVAEIEAAADWPALAAEYADETLIAGMPPPLARWPTYRALEAAGVLGVFGAWDGDRLVGFLSILNADLPRYGRRIAMSESFFVARAYRKGGTGLRLLALAEAKARELGSPALFVTAPFEGDLFKVLPRKGYAEAARVFVKVLP